MRLAERYERGWAGASQANLCVTKAMRVELEQGWGLKPGSVTVFYDRPPDFFRPAALEVGKTRASGRAGGRGRADRVWGWVALHSKRTSRQAISLVGLPRWARWRWRASAPSALPSTITLPHHARAPAPSQEKHALLAKLQPLLAQPLHPSDFAAALAAGAAAASAGSGNRQEETVCTSRDSRGRVTLRGDRPALVVSSTSWTPDEDFGLLLRAAELYDAKVCVGGWVVLCVCV